MNKVQGNKDSFALVRQDASRVIVSYGYEEIEGTEYATWYEIYYYRKPVPVVTIDMVREDLKKDVDANTDEKILQGMTWQLVHGWKWGTDTNGEKVKIDLTGQVTNVWLSMENQYNFSEADRVAQEPGAMPMTFKVWEEGEDKNPIYEDFLTYEEVHQFYLAGAAYKKATLEAGWAVKDGFDWQEYEEALDAIFNPQPSPEPEPEVEEEEQ